MFAVIFSQNKNRYIPQKKKKMTRVVVVV